ncbi:ATP-binding cassette domain-containing protein [Campylobacter fetus]|nr:ATP-binding cassette domain-containing protein [Campylobacter fetus]EJU9539605.1 ABC transporter ATP-binding protein [Campylobacter fetus]
MVLNVNNISFSYADDLILNRVSFDILKGETVSILGKNGIGKSTLLKILLSLQSYSSGEIFIDGVNIRSINLKHRARFLGYVPQAENSTFAFLVKDIILMGRNAHLGLFQRPSKYDLDYVLEAADIVGITNLLSKNIYELSGGEKQLVLIARALCLFPKLLIMDEPISYLDVFHQNKILSLINLLNTKYNISVLFTSHYPDHTLAISHKTLLLNGANGAIFGESKDILTDINLKNLFGISFFGLKINEKDRLLPKWNI